MTLLLAGLLLGAAGSAHCVFMCGPLVLTAAGSARGRSALSWLLPYHAGRLLTYELLGLVAGVAGRVISVGGLGRALSVACGVVVLMTAVGQTQRFARLIVGPWARTLSRAGSIARKAAGPRPAAARFAAGVVNGLLPCGFAYTAAMTAAALGGLFEAALFMSGFGVGTLPALVALSLSAASMPRTLRTTLARAVPVALLVTGVLLIARGVAPVRPADSSVAPVAAAAHRHW